MVDSCPRARQPAGGYTLIELMVSMLIIAILMASIFPVLGRATLQAKNSSLKMNARIVQSAIVGYSMDHNGNFPTSRQQFYSSATYQQLKNPFIANMTGIATWGNTLGASADDNADRHAPITIWNLDPQPSTSNEMLGTVLYIPYKTLADAQSGTSTVQVGGDAGNTGFDYYTIEGMSMSELDSSWTAPLESSRLTNW